MKKQLLLAALCASALSVPVQAATIADPAGDFLPSFVGNPDPDLDVLSFSVGFNGATSEFILGAVLGGPINASLPGLYVIGVDTGTGVIAPFGGIGAPNVKFNQVVIVRKDGTGTVTGASGGDLAASAITIVDNIFTARVPLSFLPSTGFGPQRYGWNLWPRNGLGNNNQISDFAPDNGTLAISVPEPASWFLMITGMLIVGSTLRQSRRYRVLS